MRVLADADVASGSGRPEFTRRSASASFSSTAAWSFP